MTDMMINKLPSKTWNWLKVNETKLPWDMEHTTGRKCGGERRTCPFFRSGRGRIQQ